MAPVDVLVVLLAAYERVASLVTNGVSLINSKYAVHSPGFTDRAEHTDMAAHALACIGHVERLERL